MCGHLQLRYLIIDFSVTLGNIGRYTFTVT